MKKRYIIAFIITLLILWITNPFWLVFKAKHHAHFEFYIFTIIFICGYLLSLKLTEYLADFKNIKQKSRVEIVFLAVFFTMLFIPMIHIDHNAVKSKAENRNLATYKPLFEKNYKINYNFGNNFNNWFNDRFFLRDSLISYFYLIKMHIDKYLYIQNCVYIKNNRWILGSNPSGKPFNINLQSNFGKYIKNLQKFCDKNNIKLYVMIAPDRNAIYADKYLYAKRMPEKLIPEQIISNFNIIYPYAELLKASKNDYVYFKTDHHYTDYGALIVNNILLEHIKKDFPQVDLIDEKDYTIKKSKYVKSEFKRIYNEGVEITHYCPFLKKYKKRILNAKYKYYTHKNENKLKQTAYYDNKKQGRDFEYPYGANLKVVLIGSSINENLNDFLPYQFKNLKYIRVNGPIGMKEPERFKILKYYKSEIVEYKPDIMIFSITLTNVNQIIQIRK